MEILKNAQALAASVQQNNEKNVPEVEAQREKEKAEKETDEAKKAQESEEEKRAQEAKKAEEEKRAQEAKKAEEEKKEEEEKRAQEAKKAEEEERAQVKIQVQDMKSFRVSNYGRAFQESTELANNFSLTNLVTCAFAVASKVGEMWVRDLDNFLHASMTDESFTALVCECKAHDRLKDYIAARKAQYPNDAEWEFMKRDVEQYDDLFSFVCYLVEVAQKKEADEKRAQEKKEKEAKKVEDEKKAQEMKETKKKEEEKKAQEAKKAEDEKRAQEAKKAEDEKKANEKKAQNEKKAEEKKFPEPKKNDASQTEASKLVEQAQKLMAQANELKKASQPANDAAKDPRETSEKPEEQSTEDAEALARPSASACRALHGVSRLPLAGPPSDYVVQDLDAILLLFQRAFIGQRAQSASKQLVQLCEFEADTGLPPVLARDGGLWDVANQLPTAHASILLPYFEDVTGTKAVQGRRVEGGEGHGLRKDGTREFFTSMSLDAQRRWGRLTSSEGILEPGPVMCVGSRLKLQPLEAPSSELHQLLMAASNGDRIKLLFSSGHSIERTVTGNMPMPGGGSSIVVDAPFEEGRRVMRRGVATVPAKENLSELTIRRAEVQKPAQPLFEFHRGTGQQWFSSHANSLYSTTLRGESLAVRYRAFGKLIALALANHCKLSFPLPLLFFQFLLQPERAAQLDDLKGFDNALHASLRKCFKMKAAQFMQIKEPHCDLSGWELEGLAPTMSVEEYVAEQAILTPQALDEVRAGFWSLVPATVVEDVTPSELRQIVCPTIVVREDTDMGLRQIFRVVFEDDVSECQPLVEAFHAVLDALSKDETLGLAAGARKKKFLMFVTGIEVPPEPGTEQLTVQMPFSGAREKRRRWQRTRPALDISRFPRHVEMLGKLPQAHTCTNTLELPNYYESLQESGRYAAQEGKATRALMSELKSVMKDRLLTAIVETDSYELDATEVARNEEGADEDRPRRPVFPDEDRVQT
eukprot:g723.t1